MADAMEADDFELEPNAVNKKNNKKLSVERIYQKKTQLEHILLRPDTYIGSVEPVTQTMWVYDEDVGMVNREVTFVPGLYKIFDEILVNAADNKQRDKNMDSIKIDINPEKNCIRIWNNGQGIPVVEHKDEKMFVPSLIFGHLLTSSNYNDEERKVTGGRNGYGAKLCNIFSTKFTVETASKMYKKEFKQTWSNNMGKTEEPRISPYRDQDFTCITFYPDLSKFKMTELDKDIVALMTRRAYDVAGCSRGVKVYLNGKKLPIKGFKDYIELYIKGKKDEMDEDLKVVHEMVNDRWEIAVTISDHGFQQVSFVNSIATTKGGRHVDYITDQLTSKISEVVKKKNKGGKDVKPFQIKTHLWVFVNCLIENPTFDSQTKENMTLQVKNFGSKCQLTDKFINLALKSGVVEAVMSWVRFKAQTELAKKCSGKKQTKLKGIPKLEDANDAGTKHSIDCTLILTEGDSAKSLAVSGLGVVGRDKYGVFPLKGKLLNVREASHKQILENAEINNIIKIMGLQYKKKYETVDDLKTLRYGRLMIMTDQDQDGSHIKGLLINFIHHNWPGLLRLPFLEEFITPIVKATKGKEEKSFFSLPEFEEWKRDTSNWHTYKIKYYKGLGTSTSKEAKEYFSDMPRHRIKFHYSGTEDDNAIQLAFSKKLVDMRKEWLSNGMEERKRRKELGLPELYLYAKDTTRVTYNDFVNKELILFSNMDNERSIPSMVDGLKPGQRKIIFTCLKRNDKKEVKVAQLAGSVAEHSAYHHGEVSLTTTIINLAQNFVGSNNINLLMPIGQFGTRLQGGKDSASPRYIFTMLSPLTRLLFSSLDQPLLNHLYDDNLKIEPEYYVPIIPMVLVNGADGIGTGWSTKIPNYNPRDIVKNILRMLDKQEPVEMIPWFKDFRGTIQKLDKNHFLISGEVALLEDNKIEITELPVRTWTQSYKESVLEPMLHGSEKVPSFITDYKEYHTDSTVRFVVTMTADKLKQAKDQGIHKTFKLQTSLSTTSMVCFDRLGCLRKYDDGLEILKEFFDVRFDLYEKRKEYLVGFLTAEALRLKNQARFILENIEGKVVCANNNKAKMIAILQDKGYDSDPVAAWKESQAVKKEEENESDDESEKVDSSGPDYNYIMGMNFWNLTNEKRDELLRKRDEKVKELEDLKSKTPSDLWRDDLNEFMTELDRVEQMELEEASSQPKAKAKLVGKKKKVSEETKPSPFGERVPPEVDEETKKKVEKKVTAPGEPKRRKKKDSDVKKDDNEDDDRELSFQEKVNAKKEKKTKGGMKQTTINFKSIGKKSPTKNAKKGKRNPWSDSESDRDSSDMSDAVADDFVIPKEKNPPRRAAANRAKYRFDSDDNEDEDILMENNDKDDANAAKDDSDADSLPVSKETKTNDNINGASSPVMSDSDDGFTPANNEKPSDDMFDSLLGIQASNKTNEQKPPLNKTSDSDSDHFEVENEKPKLTTKKRARKTSGGSSDDDFKPEQKKAAPKAKRGPKKKTEGGSKQPKAPRSKKQKKKSDSDDEFFAGDLSAEEKVPMSKPVRQARGKAATKYNFDDDFSDEDF